MGESFDLSLLRLQSGTGLLSPRLCLFGIVAIAVLARFVALDSNPAGVFHDEAEKGYSAWSLAKVGGVFDFTDLRQREDGGAHFPRLRSWPLFVDVWGSTTSMVYQYAALPLIAATGPRAWSVRFPAALIGVLTVVVVFFLMRDIAGRESADPYLAALFCALSPWHVVFSRWAQQGIFVPLFLTAGVWAMLRARRSPRPVLAYLAAGLAFGMAFYSYSGARPFLLLFFLWIGWLYRGRFWRQASAFAPGLIALLLLMALTFHAMLGGGGEGLGRFEQLSVFGLDAPLWTRALVFARNYAAHFSPQFLFLSGDANPRHSVPGFGVMLHLEFVFFLGGVLLAGTRRGRFDLLLLGWLLLSPVSAALTREGIPHALRTLHAVPCPQMLAAYGAMQIARWLRAKAGERMASVLQIGYAANAVVFLVVLFAYYPWASAPAFEYGVGQALRTAKENTDPSLTPRAFVMSGHALPYVPELYHFHWRTPPRVFEEKGIEGAPVQLGGNTKEIRRVTGILRTGQALILSAADYGRLRAKEPNAFGQSFRFASVTLRSGWFGKRRVNLIWVVLKRDSK